ncbi:MAG: hypothetical protein A2505_02805 [Deltaproteobacteria bacterium RIFOXYD12_FULL_55_16]|nr:MAG: hypothetical protein A2505_02805 [Deltaproteobacteria bacterium RIFOXYD12_FULL_55_16]
MIERPDHTQVKAILPPRMLLPLGIIALAIPLLAGKGAFFLPINLPSWLPLSFATFHGITEIFSVLVAILVFSTGFHLPEERRPMAQIILAAAFLGVGLLDFFHLMSYPGMADFLTPNTPHKTLIFWLAARLLAGGAMVAYVLLPTSPLPSGRLVRPLILAAVLAYTFSWGYVGIWKPEWLPLTYNYTQGLTSFKIAAEWLIIFLLLAALTALLAQKNKPGTALANREILIAALVLMIGSELCFTLYRHLTDTVNALGHIYKVLAFLMIYRGIFLESVRLPILRLDMTRRALEQAGKEWQYTFDAINDPVFIHDSHYRVIRCNQAYAEAAGLPVPKILGQPYYEIFPKTNQPLDGCLQALNQQKSLSEVIYVPENERYYNSHFILVADENSKYRHSLHVMNDITDLKRQEEELRYHATHDSLTALPNRTMFIDRLDQAMSQARRSNRIVVVMFLDLDNFKAVNDGFGHARGDELLVKIAGRLREALRHEDTVSRLGGDEFAILLPEIATIDNVTRVVEKVIGTFTSPILLDNDQEIYTGASIGIACFPKDGIGVQNLIRHADLAMYHAKATNRGSWAFFNGGLNRHLRRNLRVHTRLKHALAEGGLTLHYQPQVITGTGALISAEALLRWRDDELGQVSPADFIPIAEATGLIQRIDEWVLTTACRQVADWHRQGRSLPVAINVSAIHFRQAAFVDKLQAIMHATGAPANLLTIELTETAAMADLPLAMRHFQAISDLGLRIALDDFGTGHSSLGYLKSLPVNYLKIDRSFIMNIEREHDQTLVQTIIGLAHSMGITVVAEGVETEAQRDFLNLHGCDFCQGWLFARDLPAGEMEKRLPQ